MILICQSCQSRYHVDPQSLGEGRQVRCVSCGHVWHQDVRAAPPLSDNFLGPTPDNDYLTDTTPTTPDPRLPSRSRARTHLWIWCFVFGVLLLPASFLWNNQDFFVSFKQNVQAFITLLGKKSTNPQEIFKIGQLRSEILLNTASQKKIRLDGEITNTSKQVQALPPIKIHFWGKNPTEATDGKQSVLLETKVHNLEQSHLLPGESLSFCLTFPADFPHLTATSVTF